LGDTVFVHAPPELIYPLPSSNPTGTMLAALSFVALLASAAEAHFTLLYPGPRGLIDYDASVNFCGMSSTLIEK
jgi:hypothetical protein